MKFCTKCEQFKSKEKDFCKNKTKKDGLQTWCKKCMNRENTISESIRPTTGRKRLHSKSNRIKRQQKIRKMVVDFLKSHPCVDCGETDILVLEFDHVRGEKLGNIGSMTMITGTQSENRVLEEMIKCDIRCANCHRRKTGQTSWRLSFVNCA